MSSITRANIVTSEGQHIWTKGSPDGALSVIIIEHDSSLREEKGIYMATRVFINEQTVCLFS